jgi:hypothetical protein
MLRSDSTDLTSLNDREDRLAVVIRNWWQPTVLFTLRPLWCARTNYAKLAYNAVGDWLEGAGVAGRRRAFEAWTSNTFRIA